MTTSQSRSLSHVVRVRARFCRSVHLGRDFARSLTYTSDEQTYRITPSAHLLLETLADAWNRPADRALTLVGPYGAGKSAFAVFVSGVVSGRSAELKQLEEHDIALARQLSVPERRLLPVPIVGAREPLGTALLRGLRLAVEDAQPEFWREISNEHGLLDDTEIVPSGRTLVSIFEGAAKKASQYGFAGLFVIADEVGKFLEYAALHPREGDIFVLQELAEAAARSQAPLFVLSILHQNADAYAHKLGRAHQAEWAKVGERFREVPFFPSDSERMDMVGFALDISPEAQACLGEEFARLSEHCAELLPQSLAARFGHMAQHAYPLHPLVLLALPALFRKTGQSHRSLFNFLSGEEAHALGRYLRETPFTPEVPPLFPLDALFDYTAETLLGGWSAGALARMWAEAVEAIERALHLSTDARRTLKIIALLGLLRDPHLPASERVLTLALCHSNDVESKVRERVENALSELKERRLIVWSRTRGVYRLWEGGDVDVEAALDAARESLPSGVTMKAVTDRNIYSLPRLIARRHSFETGTLRGVETRPCTLAELPRLLQDRRDLSVVLCLCETEEDEERAYTLVSAHDGPNVLVGIARESDALREAARDIAACAEVAQNTPALQSDKAARRELDARRFEAESAFRDEWSRLFGPTSSASWFHQGQPQTFGSSRDFSAFLSRLADATFPNTPILRNELINRHSLSSAAAAGRRELIEAMLENPTQPRLAIKGHPPELSMYECLIRATGLHREEEPGRWTFGEPPENDPARLRSVWSAIEEVIFSLPPVPRPVTELWATLAAPPFGLAEGVMPPLLLAFLLAHSFETTLYREGTFVAEPKPADWELLLRRPEMFAVAGCRIEDERARIVERLAKGLKVAPYAVPLASALVRNMKRLPEYARQTNHLPTSTRALRRALESVSSPEKLLFTDLPEALGVGGLFGNEQGEVDVEAFFASLNEALTAWQNALPNLFERAQAQLVEACGFVGSEDGWSQLREAARELQGRTSQPRLITLLDRLTGDNDEIKTLDSVLSLVANRPPRSWTDADEERFAAQARSWGELFRTENKQRVSQNSWGVTEDFSFGSESDTTYSAPPSSGTQRNGNGVLHQGNGIVTTTTMVVDVSDTAETNTQIEELAHTFGEALSELRVSLLASSASRSIRLAALRRAFQQLESDMENEL